MRLLRVAKSDKPNKTYVAVFDVEGKIRNTYFGAPGYQDFTTHHDPQRREQYRKRHEKDLETHDPTRAGFLSSYCGEILQIFKRI